VKIEDIENHEIIAAEMDWCELAVIIMDLELEKEEMKEHLSSQELKKYDKLLEIYENEKIKKYKKF
jgi:hypothetical protein